MPRIFNSITDLIGGTPLLRLNRLSKGLGAEVLVKLESFNPGGSVKDRIGFSMLKDAEERGLINKDIVRIGATVAFIMLIAAEMMGASSGLGWFVAQSQESYHVLRIFAGATVITFLAVLTDFSFKLLRHRWTFWSSELTGNVLEQGRGI